MWSAATVLWAFRGVYHGNSMLSRLRCAALAACIYLIWNARNRALFDNEKADVAGISKKIKLLLFHCIPQFIHH